MSQPKFADVYGGKQVLTTSKFTIDFYNVPSAIVDTTKLKIYGRSSALPDIANTVVDTRIAGFQVSQPDLPSEDNTWTFIVIEQSDASIWPTLFDWNQLVMGSESAGATEGYDQCKAIQTVYNLFNQPASQIEIFNVWPFTIPTVQPESAGGAVVEYAVQFRISRYRPMGMQFK